MDAEAGGPGRHKAGARQRNKSEDGAETSEARHRRRRRGRPTSLSHQKVLDDYSEQ